MCSNVALHCILYNHIYRRRSQYHDWDGTRLSLWAASCLSKDSIIEYISLKCWTFSLYRVVFYWSMTMCHPVEFVASNLFLTFQEGQICGGPRGWIPGGGAGGYLRSSSSSCKLKLVLYRWVFWWLLSLILWPAWGISESLLGTLNL